MRKSLVLLAWVVALSAACSACRSLPVFRALTCDELLAVPLQSYIGQEIDPEVLATAVVNAYNIPRHKAVIDVIDKNHWIARWEYKNYYYAASTDDEQRIDRIAIEHYSPNSISSGGLIECLNYDPKWYSAYYGVAPPRPGNTFHLDLYFPEQGIVAVGATYKHTKDLIIPLNDNYGIDNIVIYAPGTLSDLYEQRWRFSIEAADPAWRPLPWPGDWTAIHWVEDSGASE